MKLTKSQENEKIVFFKPTIFIIHKIHNFDYQSFYAQALAYKEFLKLVTLIKKHVQSVEPKYMGRKVPKMGIKGPTKGLDEL